MAVPDIERAVAKLFLAPENIDYTIEGLEKRHRVAVDAKKYDEALHASQLLVAVQKLAAKRKKASAS